MEFYLGKNDLGQEFKIIKNDIIFYLYIGKDSEYIDYGMVMQIFDFMLYEYLYSFFILEKNKSIYFRDINELDKYLQEICKIGLTEEFKDYLLSEEVMDKLTE